MKVSKGRSQPEIAAEFRLPKILEAWFWVNAFFPGFDFDSPGSLKNPGAIRQNWRSWEVPRLRKGGRRLEDLSQASFEDLKTSGENEIETTPACVPGPAGPQESGESVVR